MSEQKQKKTPNSPTKSGINILLSPLSYFNIFGLNNKFRPFPSRAVFLLGDVCVFWGFFAFVLLIGDVCLGFPSPKLLSYASHYQKKKKKKKEAKH